MSTQQPALHHGIVKQVLSGDAIVVRGKPKGGPPPERTVCLSNVTAPRLARRPIPGQETNPQDVNDQPYAWEAREFLRKKLVGKDICFTVEYKTPGSGREYGCVYLGKDTSCENMTEMMVTEGLVEVRRGGLKASDENQQRLIQLEDTAKAALKGKWAPPEQHSEHVRQVTWTLDNPRHFVSSHQKPIDAVIEHVRDCCTVRAFLLPSFQYVTVMLTGIKGPMFKSEKGSDTMVPEPFAEEARFFVESRLLQRDVKIKLEGTSGQANLLGTVLHPNGNISVLLLREGFAHCADWSMGNVTEGPKPLRDAEKVAKEKKLRIWKDYTGPSAVETKENFTAKVIEVVNGDCLMVKMSDNSVRKIFLASIRPPRLDKPLEDVKRDPKSRPRPLYDIPYMFEAREFLRKKLIAKKVNVQVDYIQPKTDDYPEKTCCTVTITNINVAEALVSKGLATVVRYRQDDDKRSAHYDDLLQAEFRAQNKGVGMHNKKEPPVIRVADVSGDVNKAKQFLPFLQRAGRVEGIVEFVASGSRLRLYIPRETCLITFLLAGISCPRGARNMPGGVSQPAEPHGEDALQFTKELALQREVEVEVESMDKGGNFIGWMYIDGTNLSIALVEDGLSSVHFTAERSNYYKSLQSAEEKAKAAKKNIWANYEEPKEVPLENEPQERNVNYKTVVVTEVTEELHFYAQNVESGPQLETLMEQLRTEMAATPPLPGSYTPKRGELCAAKFVDGEWYRARVEKVEGQNVVSVLYIDFGNRETTDIGKLAMLPATYHSLPAQAQEYCLACVALPKDEDDKRAAVDALYNDVCNKQVSLNPEYKSGSLDCVSLLYPDSKEDVAQSLISEGLLLCENRRERRLAKLVAAYTKAQDKAKKDRLCLWRYGDFTEDDTREFGYQK